MSEYKYIFIKYNCHPKKLDHLCRWLDYYFKVCRYQKLEMHVSLIADRFVIVLKEYMSIRKWLMNSLINTIRL